LRWLSENPGRWRYIEDVLQEAALRSPSVEGATDPEAGQQPTDLSSSPGFRKDGDEEDGVSLVDTPAGDCSPPCQPTSLSPPVEAPPTGGPTKAELPDSATVVISESKGPKTEATLIRAKRRKRGRGGGRQLGKQKLSAENANHGRKLSPERMRIVLDSLAEHRLLSLAAAKAGIHRKTLEYWINRSAAGDPGYDVEWQGLIWRFHEHCASAIAQADDRVHAAAWDFSMGRIIYKTDKNGKPCSMGHSRTVYQKVWKNASVSHGVARSRPVGKGSEDRDAASPWRADHRPQPSRHPSQGQQGSGSERQSEEVEGGVADDSRNRRLAVFGNSNGTIEPATCANY
jgi:hypothetical protein